MATHDPNRIYRTGIIGLGGMGQVMLAEMIAHPRFEVTAAWDREARAVDATRQSHPQLEFVASVEQLISREDVDLVYIASPPRSHAAYAEMACNQGKALFCEKPLGVDLESSRALVARVQTTGVTNAVNFTHAASADAARARKALADDVLGEVAYVGMRLHLPTWPRAFQQTAKWLRFRDEGGFTREVLSHWVFLSQRLFGAGEVVFARARFPEGDRLAEDRVIAELDFQGVPVLVNAAVGGRGPVGMEYTIWGSKRSLRLSSGGDMVSYEDDGWRPFLSTDGSTASDRVRALDNVAAMLDGAPHTAASMAEALLVQEVIEGILAQRSTRKAPSSE